MAVRRLFILTILLMVTGCGGWVQKTVPPPVSTGPLTEAVKPPDSPISPVPDKKSEAPPKPPPALLRVPLDQLPPFEDDMDLFSMNAALL